MVKKLTLFLFCTLSMMLHAVTLVGKVVGVSDGDTVVILTAENTQEKIRLWGIDAPEKTQDFGQKAKENLSNLVFGKEVKVDIKRKDRYGRHVGKIYHQEVYINLEMVTAGLAWHYKQYAKKDTDLATAEQEAREAKRGLWQTSTQVAPWDYRKIKKRKRTYVA